MLDIGVILLIIFNSIPTILTIIGIVGIVVKYKKLKKKLKSALRLKTKKD